jgi:fructose-1,6-bisphosphatase
VFDIVGDVHGHADKLVQLLKALGYNNSTGIWAHPTRKLISLGDLVDRGPQQREVIDILKHHFKRPAKSVQFGNNDNDSVRLSDVSN